MSSNCFCGKPLSSPYTNIVRTVWCNQCLDEWVKHDSPETPAQFSARKKAENQEHPQNVL